MTMGERVDYPKRAGIWQISLGAALLLLGSVGGLLSPVGEYCAGAFLAQAASKQQDTLRADHMTLTTHYEAACNAAAGMQSVLWWSLVVLGALVLAFGLLWRFGPVPMLIRPMLRPGLAVLWSGAGSLAVGVIGGWTLPVGKDCSGAFGNQSPAVIASMNTGSNAVIDQCFSAAEADRPVWWTVIGLGAVCLVLGGVLLARAGVQARRRVPSVGFAPTQETIAGFPVAVSGWGGPGTPAGDPAGMGEGILRGRVDAADGFAGAFQNPGRRRRTALTAGAAVLTAGLVVAGLVWWQNSAAEAAAVQAAKAQASARASADAAARASADAAAQEAAREAQAAQARAAAAAQAEADRQASVKSQMEAQGWHQASGYSYYQWADHSQYTCSILDCSYVLVVSQAPNGCPGGFYVEASIERGGLSVGMANGVTAGLAQGKVAAVKLEDTSGTGGGNTMHLTKVTCNG